MFAGFLTLLTQVVAYKIMYHLCFTNLAKHTVVTSSFDVQKWTREQNADHDGLVRADEVAKFMLLHMRTARNKHGKVQP